MAVLGKIVEVDFHDGAWHARIHLDTLEQVEVGDRVWSEWGAVGIVRRIVTDDLVVVEFTEPMATGQGVWTRPRERPPQPHVDPKKAGDADAALAAMLDGVPS